jgi:hypothetical protein
MKCWCRAVVAWRYTCLMAALSLAAARRPVGSVKCNFGELIAALLKSTQISSFASRQSVAHQRGSFRNYAAQSNGSRQRVGRTPLTVKSSVLVSFARPPTSAWAALLDSHGAGTDVKCGRETSLRVVIGTLTRLRQRQEQDAAVLCVT